MPHDSITITSITGRCTREDNFLVSQRWRQTKQKGGRKHNRSNTILDRLRLNNPLQLTHLFQPPLRAWKNITRSRFDISNGKLFDRAKSLSKILSSRSGLTDI